MKSFIAAIIVFSTFLVNADQKICQRAAGNQSRSTPAALLEKYKAADVNNALANALYSLQEKRFDHEVPYSEAEMIQDIGVMAQDSSIDVNFKSDRNHSSSNFAYLMSNRLFNLVDFFLTDKTDFTNDGPYLVWTALLNSQEPGLVGRILNHPRFDPHQRTQLPFHTVIINYLIQGVTVIKGRTGQTLVPLLNHPKTDINSVSNDDFPMTPLMASIQSIFSTDRGDLRRQGLGLFNLILNHPQLKPGAKLPKGETILTFAAEATDFDRDRDDVEVFQALLNIPSVRAQLNQKNEEGNTPLHIIAAKKSSYKTWLYNYLVSQGAEE